MLNLPFGEHHRRLRARGAVHAQAGLLGAPQPGPVLGIGQIGEVLAGRRSCCARTSPSAPPSVCPADERPARVGGETPGLGVFQPSDGEPGIDRIGMGDNGTHVAGRMRTLNTPPKNSHAASQPSITAARVWENVNHTNMCRE